MEKIIKGITQNAICFTEHIEQEAIEQIENMLKFNIGGEHIRVMPDVHSGKGCTIGTTMQIKDKVVPNLVGVDIGCGMLVIELGNISIDFPKLDGVVHKVPSGMNVWNNRVKKFQIENLVCYSVLKNVQRLHCSLGTLGGGNHFIEIDKDDDNNKYLVIHSGSRNLGKQVADIYQQIAIQKCNQAIKDERKNIIKTLKMARNTKQINEALSNLVVLPKELCYLSNDDMQNYLKDIKLCQEFAKQNRELIADYICSNMGWNKQCCFHTVHNYIDISNMILRKGAISAQKGEKVLIPLNMQDGSIIAIGKGNAEWNYSAPHGAGRIMSRKKAKETLSIKEFQSRMQNIFTTTATQETIDEAPMAYKPMEWIVDAIGETVEIQKTIKPIYNFKAAETPKGER